MLFRCEVCKTFCTTQAALNKHFSSPDHISRMKQETQSTSKSKSQPSSSTKPQETQITSKSKSQPSSSTKPQETQTTSKTKSQPNSSTKSHETQITSKSKSQPSSSTKPHETQITSKSKSQPSGSMKPRRKPPAKADGALSLKIVKVESIKEEDFTVSITSPQKPIVNEEKDLETAGEMLLKDEYILGADDDENSLTYNESLPEGMIVIDDGFEGGATETSRDETLVNTPVSEVDCKNEIILPESTVPSELSATELKPEINAITSEKPELNDEVGRKRRRSESPELDTAKKTKTSDETDCKTDDTGKSAMSNDDVVGTEASSIIIQEESGLSAVKDTDTDTINVPQSEQDNVLQQSEPCKVEEYLDCSKLEHEKDHSEGDSEHTEELNDSAGEVLPTEDAEEMDDMTDMMCDGEWEVKDEIDDEECVSAGDSVEVTQAEERKISTEKVKKIEKPVVPADSEEKRSKTACEKEAISIATTAEESLTVATEASKVSALETDPIDNATTEKELVEEADEDSSSSVDEQSAQESDPGSDIEVERVPKMIISDDDESSTTGKTNSALREMILKNVNACIDKYRNKMNSSVKDNKEEKEGLKPQHPSRKRSRITDGDKENAAVYLSQVLEDVAKCLSSDGFYLDDSDCQVGGDEEDKDILKDFSPIHSPEDHSFLLDDVSVEDFKMTDTVSETSLLDDVSDFSDISDLVEVSDISDVDISDFETLVGEGSQHTNHGVKNNFKTTTEVKRHEENLIMSDALKNTMQNANLKSLTVSLVRLDDESISQWIRNSICDVEEHHKEQVRVDVPDRVIADRIDLPQTMKKKSEEICKKNYRAEKSSSVESSDDGIRTSPILQKSKMSELITKRATKKIKSSNSSITADITRSVMPCAVLPNSDAASKLSNYRIPKKAVIQAKEISVRKSVENLEQQTQKKVKQDIFGSKKVQPSDSKVDHRYGSSHRDRQVKRQDKDERNSSSSKRRNDETRHSSSISSDKPKTTSRDGQKPYAKDEKVRPYTKDEKVKPYTKDEKARQPYSRSRNSPLRTDRSRHSPTKSDRERHRNSGERLREHVVRDQDLRPSRSSELNNRNDKSRRNESAVQSLSHSRASSSSKRFDSRNEKTKEQSPIDYFSDYWKVSHGKPEVEDDINQFKDRDTRGYFWAHPSQQTQIAEQVELGKDSYSFQSRDVQQRIVTERDSRSKESMQMLQSRQAIPTASVEIERKLADVWQSDVQRCVYKTDDRGLWGRERRQVAMVEEQSFGDKYSDRRVFPKEDRQPSPIQSSSESSWSETKHSVDDQVQRWIDEDFSEPQHKERHSKKIQLDFSDPQEKERKRVADSEKSSSSNEIAGAQVSTKLQDLLACVLTIPTLEQIDKDTTETIKRNILSKLSDHLQELKSAKVQSVAVNLKPTSSGNMPLNMPTDPVQYYRESRRASPPPRHYQHLEQLERRTPEVNVGYSSREKSFADMQKEQIAQELAAVLTVTGRSHVSEDLLQRLVQQAISSKTPLSGPRTSAVQPRVPEYASSSRLRSSEHSDWQYASSSENVVGNELYARRPVQQVDHRPKIHDVQPTATITREQYAQHDPNRLYTWPDSDVNISSNENISTGSRLGASTANYDHGRIQQPENVGSNVYYDRGSWQQGSAPYDVNRLYTNNPNQF